jgi:hypothetical protein
MWLKYGVHTLDILVATLDVTDLTAVCSITTYALIWQPQEKL